MNTPPTVTPWGRADYTEQVADGIWAVATPSHGGYWLSPDRAEQVPSELREWADTWAKGTQRYSGEWYEQDACAAVIPVVFPETSNEALVEEALGVLDRYAPTHDENESDAHGGVLTFTW